MPICLPIVVKPGPGRSTSPPPPKKKTHLRDLWDVWTEKSKEQSEKKKHPIPLPPPPFPNTNQTHLKYMNKTDFSVAQVPSVIDRKKTPDAPRWMTWLRHKGIIYWLKGRIEIGEGNQKKEKTGKKRKKKKSLGVIFANEEMLKEYR